MVCKKHQVLCQTPDSAFQCSAVGLSADLNVSHTVIIIGTYHDKSTLMFWSVARRLPVQENPIVAWKFCHVVHKLLRDGHHSVSFHLAVLLH